VGERLGLGVEEACGEGVRVKREGGGGRRRLCLLLLRARTSLAFFVSQRALKEARGLDRVAEESAGPDNVERRGLGGLGVDGGPQVGHVGVALRDELGHARELLPDGPDLGRAGAVGLGAEAHGVRERDDLGEDGGLGGVVRRAAVGLAGVPDRHSEAGRVRLGGARHKLAAADRLVEGLPGLAGLAQEALEAREEVLVRAGELGVRLALGPGLGEERVVEGLHPLAHGGGVALGSGDGAGGDGRADVDAPDKGTDVECARVARGDGGLGHHRDAARSATGGVEEGAVLLLPILSVLSLLLVCTGCGCGRARGRRRDGTWGGGAVGTQHTTVHRTDGGDGVEAAASAHRDRARGAADAAVVRHRGGCCRGRDTEEAAVAECRVGAGAGELPPPSRGLRR
jgi:hypothetical protein